MAKRSKKSKTEDYHSELAQMLGIYIKERRLTLKKSQQDVVDKLGFSVQFYGRIESGAVMAPQEALARIVKELKLDYSRIMKVYKLAAISEVESLFRGSQGQSRAR